MKFSGHETFPIREGWLHKGMKLLMEEPQHLSSDDAADWLGVGRNMAKSIRHWLQVTGLADRGTSHTFGRRDMLVPTELGDLIYGCDPYFCQPGTWWALHTNLINDSARATTWAWFFNGFNATRFERSLCVDSLQRHIRLSSQKRVPSLRTLENDVSCLLQSYARAIPAERIDPEEAFHCPLAELSLVSHFRASGYYQMNHGVKNMPGELLGYALSRAFSDARDGRGKTDITIEAATRTAGGPGRAFLLTNEAMFDQALLAEGEIGTDTIEISGLAGERVIRVRSQRPLAWLEAYYTREEQRSRHAA